MALNFPRPDQSPFTDPESGLKYIFNPTIGAWESAIQPPVVVTYDGNPPDIIIEGFLWFNNRDLTLYILRNGDWIPVVDGEYGPVYIGITPPKYPAQGDLWWDPVSGNLFVWYVDPDSAEWMPASANSGGGLVTSGSAYVGPFAPASPYEGMMWFNSNTEILYVYTEDTGWTANKTVLEGINSISVAYPIIIENELTSTPRIGIEQASTTTWGAAKYATSIETKEGTATNLAITPLGLKTALADPNVTFVPEATENISGTIKLATSQEVVDGVDDTKAITPAKLKSALPTLGLTNPAGTVIAFAGSTAPTGYFECDGRDVDRTTYSDLFAAISNIYGDGDTTTTFNIPDLRGTFIRGWSHGVSLDAGRQLGTFQVDSVKDHTHVFLSSPDAGQDPNITSGTGRTIPSGMISIETNTNAGGSNETKPHNYAMMYCIKY
jgi:microcystin-dependent protein